MRKKLDPIVEKSRIAGERNSGPNGVFRLQHPNTGRELNIIVTDGRYWSEEGFTDPVWEHVSVSAWLSCPIWSEMCWVKTLFWEDDECVIQYHPPIKDYVNNHSHVLHMWKPNGIEIPMPPKECV